MIISSITERPLETLSTVHCFGTFCFPSISWSLDQLGVDHVQRKTPPVIDFVDYPFSWGDAATMILGDHQYLSSTLLPVSLSRMAAMLWGMVGPPAFSKPRNNAGLQPTRSSSNPQCADPAKQLRMEPVRRQMWATLVIEITTKANPRRGDMRYPTAISPI
jgi:hypothetical protein